MTRTGSESPRGALHSRGFPAIGSGTMRPLDGFSPIADPVAPAPDVPDISDDAAAPVKGFASGTGVSPGAAIDFHISVTRPQNVTVEIYRVGAYGDQRTALLGASEPVAAVTQPDPVIDDETGLITCPWEASWRLNVPADWKSGPDFAVLRTQAGA